jgi:hypothetical protein
MLWGVGDNKRGKCRCVLAKLLFLEGGFNLYGRVLGLRCRWITRGGAGPSVGTGKSGFGGRETPWGEQTVGDGVWARGGSGGAFATRTAGLAR